MKSVRFEVKVPTEGSAYRWLIAKKEAGENMSQSIRELIETHSDMFDRMESKDRHIEALKLRIKVLESSDSPDFRSMLDENLEHLRKIRRADRDRSKIDS